MSQDRLTALWLLSYYWLTIIMPSNTLAFNVVYNKEPSSSSSFQSSAFYHGSSSSSRKFGGYRIVPRACKDATVDTSYKNDVMGGGGSGVCMFNYECTQLGGSVVGSCVDVFLFGACCRLPADVKLPHTVEQQIDVGQTTPGRRPSHDGQLSQSSPPPPPPLSFGQPVADTILLHRNGSAVQNTYRPDDMTADLMANFSIPALYAANQRPPLDDVVHMVQQQYTTTADWHRRQPASPFANKITSKVDYGVDSSTMAVKQTSSSSPVSKSTDSVPNIRKTTPSATVRPTTVKHGYADDYYDGMVQIPTLTASDPNVKTPVENNSINHILSILNQSPPATSSTDTGYDVDDNNDRDPMDTSPSYHHTQHTSSSPSPTALYTWGSIEGDSKSPGYGSSSSFPVTRPSSTVHHSSPYYPQTQHYDRPSAASSTAGGYYGGSSTTPVTTTPSSTHHLPGPHFHVLSTTTTKPAVDPIVPTVIVLSPANDKNPNKYSTATAAVHTSSSAASYRPSTPPSHVKPSQSIIVTGKPSVSAAYTTTATYHQTHQKPQQQQQNLAFVPVSSTTLSDLYYNPTNYNVHHTSSKPLVQSAKPPSTNYGHRPVTTSTSTATPPTLSSTVHHDGDAGINNNVFTTVITSVNHQYHNKYQPTTATSTVAKPVLNSDAMAVVSSSLSSTAGGYKPHRPQQTTVTADDDYPSPVVTTSPQVFITASDIHHHHHHHHQRPQQSSSAYPGASVLHADDDNDDAVSVVAGGGIAPVFNSTDTFAFPPVRDPNVNLTGIVNAQQENSDGVSSVDGVGGDYDADADSHPQLTAADDNLDDKVHLFVEKVVQSLQGNFEDLERVLLSGDPSSSNVTVGLSDEQPPTLPNKKPTTVPPTTTKKPTRPVAASSAKPTKPPKGTATSTYRPTPITLPQDAAPYLDLTTVRPTKIPALLTPVQLFQPTTYGGRPPTKQPVRPTPSTTVVLDTLNVDHDHTTAEPDYRKVCGVRPLLRKNGRIVGGTGSTFGEWPWQVLVREATWLGFFTKNKCGGVLITQKHVITAAHCQPGFFANLVAVFGEYDISGEVESKRSVSKNVKRVIVHRQYDAATFENDIALLELESPISYDQHIVPICMPDDDDDFTGRMASVTGWGRLKYGGGVPSILQEVQVPIIENQVCQDMFETAGHTKNILNSFLCAGYANGQRDSCEGDSGGPLMIEKDNGRWTLIGTVSHGIKCAAPYLPGVYMRTTYYKPWLQTITGVQ